MFSFILFADDSNPFLSHGNIDILFNTVNSELINISNWIKANKLSLNIKKTNYMLFSRTATSVSRDIIFDGAPISRVNSMNFLGMFIDDKLSWTQHVNYLCSVISRNVGILNKLKYFLPSNILYNIYNALILSHISYGILAWGRAYD